jgi:hypothetical protein
VIAIKSGKAEDEAEAEAVRATHWHRIVALANKSVSTAIGSEAGLCKTGL